MASDYLFQQSEVVLKKMPNFFGRFNLASNMIKKGTVEMIGERDFRAPFVTQEGGRFGTYIPAGGSLGRGTASKGGVMIGTFYSLRLNFELTELAVKATESKAAQFSAFKRAMKAGLPEFAVYVDKIWHGDGTAVVGTATLHQTVSAKSVYTMDTTTGVMLLRRGMPVIVYDNGLTTAYDTGTARLIEQIDYANRLVYLDGAVTAAANDDKLVFEGVSGASPAGIHGLYYHNSDATSGTINSVNRATEYEVVSTSVDAGGVPTFQKGLQLKHAIYKRRSELPKGLMWLVSPEQQANMYQNVWQISNFDLSKGKGVNTDLIPDMDEKWQFAGLPAYLDIHQRTDRLDLIIPSDWIRARLADVGFYEVGGQRFFTLIGTSTGTPSAGLWFGMVLHEDYVCQNPGNAGYIKNCAQPTY